MASFIELGVRPETIEALAPIGITAPFAIQEMVLPLALSGNDLIGQAKTGTGKTLGFGIPIIDRVLSKSEGSTGKAQALVVVPTRELCVQVAEDLLVAGRIRDIRVLALYGGRAFEPQLDALNKGIDVVVGTPGRLLDLARQGHLKLNEVRILVLDEADEMLDLGFLPDIEAILRLIPEARQTMLFSATMPGEIITLARKFMDQPTHIRVAEEGGSTVEGVEQFAYRAHAMDKIEMLARILQAEGRGATVVFCRTKRTAAKVSDELADRGFASGAVHGDLGQGAREQALRAFRNGKIDILVATDVAARGIDVEGVTHVINYQCPDDEKVYLHRIGRTGRAGAGGIAITFVDWDELARWNMINTALKLDMADPKETYSSSEWLFTDLNIAPAITGVLPRAQRAKAGLAAEEIEDIDLKPKRAPKAPDGRGNDRKNSPKNPEHVKVSAPSAPAPRKDRERKRTRSSAGE